MDVLSPAESTRLKAWLGDIAAQVEATLDGILPKPEGVESKLYDAMRYAVMGGGKRLRAALVVAAYNLAGGTDITRPLRVGAAMEMIHAYSLIQDDLPCMDNDTLRRGKPTTHIAFGEDTALMASDGLQTGAYEVLANPKTHPDAQARLDIITLFAQASGAQGMVAGQVIDMRYEREHLAKTPDDLHRMNLLKTGVNIKACALAGAMLVLPRNESLIKTLDVYSFHLGRAFQIWDDVMDVTSTAEQMGKTPGKDAKAGKSTFVTLLGLENAKSAAYAEAEAALTALEDAGASAEILRLIVRFTVGRDS